PTNSPVFPYTTLFRSDRIISISRSEKTFTKIHKELEYYRQKPDTENKSLVRFRIDRSVSKFLHFNRNFYGFTKEIKHKDYVEMHFEVDTKKHGSARWLMMFADWARSEERRVGNESGTW